MLPASQTLQNRPIEKRHMRGVSIAVSGDSIRKLSKNSYQVRSQSGNGWYRVTKTVDADIWSCTCPDFSYRLVKLQDKRCKHILAIQTLQHTFETENKIQRIERPKMCPRCFSTDIIRNGFRVVKGGIKRQRFSCDKCKRKFILGENGFSKVSSDPKIITEALNLIFSGVSFRNTARHLKLTYGRSWSHVAIIKWVRKYSEMMRAFVDTLRPELGDTWHVDEIMLNVRNTEPTGKGFYSWCWNVFDGQTKFVLASELSKRRELNDARHAFAKGNERANGANPSYVVTDGLQSYRGAFIEEFNARTTGHVRTKSLSEGFANRSVERYHNEMRSIIKARRGLGNDKSAQTFVDFYRIYHNFIRPHTGLFNDKTPAEAAGLSLNLNEQNRLKDLIAKSAVATNKENDFAGFVINQLGKRFEKLEVLSEKDCIRFKQKAWIEKTDWREINDILRINGFSWLPNGKDSCWIKLQSWEATVFS